MANFPFFGFPYHNYSYHYYPNYNKTDFSNISKQNNQDNLKQEENIEHKKTSSRYNTFGPIRFSDPFSQTNLEEPILEILGIQLYLDDIIILGLLFFLYKENVQDEMLFLSLILLLLT